MLTLTRQLGKFRLPFSAPLGVALLAAVLFLPRLGERDLWASHEARAAQNAQRLLDEANLGVPRLFDDTPELQKPPLDYWLVAAVGALRGGRVDEMAVRLPSAVAGLLCVLLVHAHLASRGRYRAAVLAAAILTTAQHFTAAARVGRIDMPLTLTVAAAVIFWRWADEGGKVTWRLAAVAAAVGGLLLKGPLGLVLPAAVLTIHAVVNREWKSLRPAWWAAPLALLFAAPWFVAAHVQTGGEFTTVFFWYHNVQRAAGGTETLASHPWYFYAGRWAFDALPWSLLAPWAVRRLARDSHARCDSDLRLGAAWAAGLTLLLSLSSFKRADYLLPAYPGAAVAIGCLLDGWFASSAHVNRQRAVTVFAVTLAAVVLGWHWQLAAVETRADADREKRSFAGAVRQTVPAPQRVLLFRVEDHALAFRLGRPLNTFLEWENLDIWAGRPGPNYVLMPAEEFADWPRHVRAGILEEVRRYDDRTERRRPRSLVLVRTRPHAAPIPDAADDRTRRPTAPDR